jgi:hypothetical protein
MDDTDDSAPPSLDSLARRYLDLWQDQWTAAAADPEVIENFVRLFQMMGQGAASFAPFFLGPTAFAGLSCPGTGWDPRPQPPAAGEAGVERPAAPAPGAAPVRPASGDRDLVIAQLLGRIAALEERLAAVERTPPGDRG